jgi:Mrp family chromosome partitioning ATPase
LLLTSEAKVLAAHAGLVLVVVEADRTPVNVVTEAFDMLRELPRVVAVLNKRRKPARDPTSYYGYR